MIYLDAAATSFQKPRTVAAAMSRALQSCASPGRGGYPQAMMAADKVLDCRLALAALFHVPEPEQVVLTTNATHGLNIAIRDLVRPGDRVVLSGYEHNAVLRPLHDLRADMVVVRTPVFDAEAALSAFQKAIPGAAACICTHVSNVFGNIFPIEEIGACCREYGVPFIVDASQSAGVLPLDFQRLGACYVAMPGHKGLMGPQGTGVLLCGRTPKYLMSGGTGFDSRNREMPDFLPERLEPGTQNIPGIAGLLEGVRFVQVKGQGRILTHERRLIRRLAQLLGEAGGGRPVLAEDPRQQGGVLSVLHPRLDCEAVAAALGRAGVCTRAGLHCAPLAHETAGDLDRGSLRFSVSGLNTEQEIRQAGEIYRKVVTKM